MDPPPAQSGSVSRWFNPYLPHEERDRRSTAPLPVIRPRFIVLEMRDALSRLLTRYLDGAEIVTVFSPERAMEELARMPVQALLVNMPGGDEIARSLRASGAVPRGVPLITCYIPGIHDSANTLPVSDYLVKPVSRHDLLASIDRLELDGKTILLVDDEPDALRLFRRMLTSAERGFRVLRASDGEEAIRMLSSVRPDVVLLDLVMPNMDGFHFLATKDLEDDLRDIPVIVISARDPMGQPIVSDALAITQKDGLSVPQLLACIDAVTEILATARQAADPAPRETPAD
jgi:CheY-like chemotaxis protein